MSMSFKIFTKKCQLIPEATEQPVMEVDQNGSKVWYLNGNLHRTDGPAMVYADGTKSWYINGVKHRTDGPAFESVYGTKEWWVNGKRHRTDGPAIEYADGTKVWWLNGERHRTDGPAYEGADGHKAWYINNKLHRTDGPAVEDPNGYKAWYLHGIKYTHKDWKAMVNISNNFKKLGKVNLDETTEQPVMTVDKDGVKVWKLNGLLHRADGPAVIYPSKNKVWYLNGKRHRTDGPAFEGAFGSKQWYINGELHRTDGPAVEDPNGGREWWINSVEYSYEDWKAMANVLNNFKKLSKVNLDEATEQPVMTVDKNGDKRWRLKNGELHRTDGPAYEDADGTKIWWVNGEIHRTDGPAVEDKEGKEWLLNGFHHRTDGPAIEWADGKKEWWVNGIEYSYKDWKAMANISKNLKNLGKVNLDETTEQPVMHVDDMGTKRWYLNGKLHRIDEPAVVYVGGRKLWYLNGKMHRTDGPAYLGDKGGKLWYIHGIEYSYNDWVVMVDILNNFKKLGKVNLDEATEQPVMTVDEDGDIIWELNGKMHRTDGPAFEGADGSKAWWINGELHRTDGPAFEGDDGYKAWYLNGKLHRTDGPAVEGANGYKAWYIHGIKYTHKDWKSMVNISNNFKKLSKVNLDEATEQPVMEVDENGSKVWKLNGRRHRTDGPAVIYSSGTESWYINGKLHRIGGPAVEWADGSETWWVNGQLHRTDGPAVNYANGSRAWWLNNIEYSHKDWKAMVDILNNFKKLGKVNLDEATEQPVMTVDKNGDKRWTLKNGKIHRTDGPAMESKNGDKQWYLNGLLHRTDGPAIEGTNGFKVWRVNGEYHRTDGPAIEWPDGSKSWYIHGIQYDHEDWKAMVDILNNFKKLGKVNLDETTEQPVMTVDKNGNKIWKLNGKFHRTDGPAFEDPDGRKSWWINGERHRTDGPAYEGLNGDKSWWINGIKYSHKDWKTMVNILNNFKKLGKLNLDEATEQPVMTVDEDGDKLWRLKNGNLHRTDGPAIENHNGDKSWWVNGKPHRTDGPAFEGADGYKVWWVNGELHRTDGPAREGLHGYKEWRLKNVQYSHKDWKAMVDISNNFKKLSKVNLDEATEQPVMTVDKDGDKRWRLNGDLHRTDGPAFEGADGTKTWWLNGKRHRTDGPAVEGAFGSKRWYINGIKYSYEDWKTMIDISNNFKKLGKVNLDEATDKPVMHADKAGNKIWKLNGKLHRTDGPAIEYAYGRKAWCINGERHRADGPAIVNADGSKEWYINGIQYSYEDWKVMVDILTNFKKLGKLNINEDI